MSRRGAGSIQPLPKDVVAQLKSSTAIVSLTDVVLELLKNALDAGATKIEATVDFGRGSCTIEDDGLGIAPVEFREEGGIGKLYSTSKYFSDTTCLGRHGTFLASLAAVSLLTITSHHHEHRSHNSITFHHSRPVERQLPAPSGREVKYAAHGTRATVRNLFGNLPVRVKQRAVVVEQKSEHDRLWDSLRREVTGLLLSWRQPVSLRIRDASYKTIVNFTGQASSPPATATSAGGRKPRPSELQYMLDTLSQAGYISALDWSSWVPASASTSTISVKGAISLEPAPTRRTQFISLGIRPLSAESGHNELYDQVNRLFALSSFGTEEDDVDITEGEKLRRENDRRFKSDRYTNRQLKGRKGVDRYPMFHLRITLKDQKRDLDEDQLFDREANLQAVLEVLQAMLTQWLLVHYFRPQKPRTRQSRPATAIPVNRETGQQTMEQSNCSSPMRGAPLRPSSAMANSRKRKSSTLVAVKSPMQGTLSTFQAWSRIKSGKSGFYDNIWTPTHREDVHSDVHSSLKTPKTPACRSERASLPSDSIAGGFVKFDMKPILPGSLQAHTSTPSPAQDIAPTEGDEQVTIESERDETMTWIDPMTKRAYLLNARTGCVITENTTRPKSDSSAATPSRHSRDLGKTLRLQKTAKTADEARNPWLNGLLRTWNNPVFKATEKRIQNTSMLDQDENTGSRNQSNHFHCSNAAIDKALGNASLTSAVAKLSKDALRDAQIIAQVDKKFILVKMSSGEDVQAETLVLIDQHAADERVRVESLLTELCTDLSDTSTQYRSRLGHVSRVAFSILEKPQQFSVSTAESSLFTAYAAYFATWGILFDISLSQDSAENGRAQSILSVTALPPSISERCKADPKLLISFLRSTVWKYDESPTLSTEDLPSRSASDNKDGSPIWLKRLSSCPPGLVDLVNSRACRSAIMFNDELSIQECGELVAKLSACVFPFMCAHGRPSMVPLVNLGDDAPTSDLGFGAAYKAQTEGSGPGTGFVNAWKKWKR